VSVSVLIPTTGRRAAMLAQVAAAFAREPAVCEVLTIVGHSWGEGLNRLAARATGDLLLTCCDDTVPCDGWYPPAKDMLDMGLLPVPRYLTTTGAPVHEYDAAEHWEELDWARCYLLPRRVFEEVGPFLDLSWFVDMDYSARLIAAGYRLTACDRFAFTHLYGERDWLTAEEMERQRNVYMEAQRVELLP
jgi:pimeloyl-ACP methyl ester carboxylesterase